MSFDLRNCSYEEIFKEAKDGEYDLAICDPPYGIERLKNPNGRMQRLGDTRKVNNDVPTIDYLNQLFKFSKNQIIWGYNHFSSILPNCTGFVFWDKDVSVDNYSDGELAWTSFDKNATKVKITWDGFRQENMKDKEVRVHPTQKPVALYKWLLQNYAKPGDKILDTHLGSMSIAIAVQYMNDHHGMNLTLTGSEIDPDYYTAGIKRLKQYQQQLTIF